MAELLKGKAAADSLTLLLCRRVEELKRAGTVPRLAIVRVGENAGDLSYEKGALKRGEQTGVDVRRLVFGAETSQEELLSAIEGLNSDKSIHGVLIFRPLPKHIDDSAVCEALDPAKDMDGITPGSMAGVFTDRAMGYPPCTAEACMEILDHYDVELSGSKVTVMGRSLVIGKPVAMMAMKKNATVTVCHSRTRREDFKEAGKNADIVIAALGKAEMIKSEDLGSGQVIVDVGINVNEEGRLCGDVDFDEAEPKAAMITPVPGGVGSMTTALLMKHVVQAAEKAMNR